jgi:hypothetical protein
MLRQTPESFHKTIDTNLCTYYDNDSHAQQADVAQW